MNWINEFLGEIKHEINSLKTGKKDLRDFGLVMAIVCLALAGLAFYRGHLIIWPWAIGLCFLMIAFLFPRVLRQFYLLWMGLAVVLGYFVSRLILSILFYLMVTPIAFLKKIFSEPDVSYQPDKNKKSYWIVREKRKSDERDLERPF